MRHANLPADHDTTRAAIAISCFWIPVGLIVAPFILFGIWWAWDWYSRTPAGTHPLITAALMVVVVSSYVAWVRRERS